MVGVSVQSKCATFEYEIWRCESMDKTSILNLCNPVNCGT